MIPRFLRLLFLSMFLLGLSAPLNFAQAAPFDLSVNKPVSPKGFLNADGTLKLDGAFSGTLDLKGWSVQIDDSRGPVFSPVSQASQSPLSSPTPGTWAKVGDGKGSLDDRVLGIAVSGTNVYVVGNFTDAANIPAADYVAKWNGSTWSAMGSNGSGDGAINFYTETIAVSGSDVYVGGDFDNVNNNGTILNTAGHIAKWDGSNWSALGSNGAGGSSLNGTVFSIAVSGSDLYVGGNFTNVNDSGTVLTAADYIAKWDGSHWSALGSDGAGNGSLNNEVIALAVSGANVYAGGYFTDVNNGGSVLTAADYVAEWNGSGWSALGSDGAGGGSLDSTVYALAVGGSDLYVAGGFTNVNNNGSVLGAADYIAMWDGSNWSSLSSDGSGGGSLNGNVDALVMSGSTLYVGGGFRNVNNNGTVLGAADSVAQWDGANWSALGSNGSGDGAIPTKAGGYVQSLAVTGTGSLIVGGFFFDLNNGGTVLPQADFIAQWNGSSWSGLGASANGALVSGYTGNLVSSIAVIGPNLYVGGRFINVSNHGINIPEAGYIAKWDGSNWSALGSDGAGGSSLNNNVYALAVMGSDLYVGGEFSNVNNNGTLLPAADFVAMWDGTNWSALGSNGAGDGALTGNVSALAVSGTNLYVGGSFTNVNNNGTPLPAADYVAKWDGSNWSALSSNGAGNGSLNADVTALTVSGTNLYVGGGFTDVNNNSTALRAADYIAKWDGSNWSALGSNGASNGSLNDYVFSIAGSDNNLYVGGVFTNVNNNGTPLLAADSIARWDGSNWSALGSNGFNDGALGNSRIDSILLNGTNVYAGGSFTSIENNGTILNTAAHIARWDGANWSALGSDGAGGGSLNNWAESLGVQGLDLVVGGYFANVNNNGTVVPEADYLATYEPPLTSPFSDVGSNYWAVDYIQAIFDAGITTGCGAGTYCPTKPVSRDQMAIFLLKGVHSANYVPPPVGGSTGFSDVPTSYWAAAWIKELAAEGITGGCGGGNYCPTNPVTRDQMAVFLLKAEHGILYAPPAVGLSTGFNDVSTSYWAAPWIKQLAAEGITGGCGGGNYCPTNPVTRDQMAVFLEKTFKLIR